MPTPDPSVPDRDIPGIIAPPPLLYAGALAAGLLVHHWYPRHFLPLAVARPVGIAALVLGSVAFFAVYALRSRGTSPNPWHPTSHLVIAGPYRFSRNPIYVGFTLWYLGIACWVDSLWPVLLLPVVLVVMHWGVVTREEAYLERRFGDEYRQYRRRVRRWL